ncbi:TonB-dependent receptor [Steroidobacter sp.]|uniref:TonB-dependent receptor n=1 Tax=Steroidobacter sp. TaxID=1978227 RepID=UPI001A4EEF52|nr:TonB-dependent receptor [Steroidobacter sp.]MBL8266726.1 TonB-dependent receptor [Steroidobacter sp.]
MRTTAVAAAISIALLGVSMAQNAHALIRKATNIPESPLGPALRSLAKDRKLHVLFRSELVRDLRTAGAVGELTTDEALNQLLSGTSLTFQYLDEKTITVVPMATSYNDGRGELLRVAQADDTSVDTASREPSQNISEVLVSARKPFTEGNMDIRRTQDDAQPYQIIGRAEIEKSGAADVEGLLKKSLPMNTVAGTHDQQPINASGDISQVNLRGIGTNQTLILINGRRTANIVSFGETLQPDIKAIPIGAVERIEVLPVSSSAIYGGSAIGGVVNVVLKRDYEGGEVSLKYRSPFDVDAPVRTVNASYGLSLEEGRTHFMVGARYSDAEAPLSRDRSDYMNRGRERILRNNPSLLLLPSAPYIGGTTGNIGSVNGQDLVLKAPYGGGSLGSNITYVPVGTSAATSPLDLGAGLRANASSYNFAQPNSTGSDAGYGLNSSIHGVPEIKSLIASARRQMSDNVNLFSEFYHSEYLASAPRVPYSSSRTIVSRLSPINPFQQDVRITLPGAAADEAQMEVRNRTTRVTAGVLVDLPYDWQVESDYTWTENQSRFRHVHYIRTLAPAFNSGALNPFVDLLANPVDLTSYQARYGGDFPSQLENIALRAAGPIGRLPAGSPTLALGLEYRKESMKSGRYFWDYAVYTANNLNWNYLPKSQQVASAYAELKVPLVSAANSVPLVRELDLQLSGRSEHFKVATGTSYIASADEPVTKGEVTYSSTNPTIGLRYRPVDQLMLRASYATGFLPPDYIQFLEPQLGGGCTAGPTCTVNVIDPQRGNEVVAVNFLDGGNPNIKPQSSTSWGVGLVWTPTFIEGLRANLEWYRLALEDVAVTPTAQQIVNLEREFPGRVRRDSTGQISLVDFSLINANQLRTEGFDLSLDYQFAVERLGTFQISALATVIRYFDRQAADAIDSPLENIVDQVANGGPLKHKGNLGLSWARGAWKLDWLMTYFGSYDQFDNGGLTAYVVAQGSEKIPSQTYHDAVMEYRWDERGGALGALQSGLTVQFGINNVFDKTPPIDVYQSVNGYGSPFGDWRLREYWVALSKRF